MIDQYESLIFAAASSNDYAAEEVNKLAHLIDSDDELESVDFAHHFYGKNK